MGSRIAQGDTAARERIAIASALHVGGTSGEKSRPPVHRGGAKRGVGGSPSQVGNVRVESFRPPDGCFRETIAENPTQKQPIPEKPLKTTARKRKPWSMLGCDVCYLSPSLAGWGLRGGGNLTYPSHMYRHRQNRTYRRQLGPLYHCQPRPHSCCYPCLRRHHPFGCFPRHLHGCH